MAIDIHTGSSQYRNNLNRRHYKDNMHYRNHLFHKNNLKVDIQLHHNNLLRNVVYEVLDHQQLYMYLKFSLCNNKKKSHITHKSKR